MPNYEFLYFKINNIVNKFLFLFERPLMIVCFACAAVMDSPSRKTSQSRSGTLSCADSVILHGDGSYCCSEDCQHDGDDFPYACSHRHSPFWPSAESSRVGDLDSNYGCGDTTSVREMPDSVSQIHADTWGHDMMGRNRSAMERCTSCFSKLGAPTMSRSSTCTPGTPLAPVAWPMEPPCCHHTNPRPKTAASVCDRMSMSSHDSSETSEYSVPRLSCFTSSTNTVNAKPCACQAPCQATCQPSCQPLCQPSCQPSCQCPPARPPKPCQDQTSPSKKKRKAPMPLPDDTKDKDYVVHTCACHNPHLLPMTKEEAENPMVGPYENYDVPRPLAAHLREDSKSPDPNQVLSLSQSTADEYYDTPKNVKECLSRTGDSLVESPDQYGNYDTPPPAKHVPAPCAFMLKCKTAVVVHGQDSAKTVLEGDLHRPADCPCQRVTQGVTCWPQDIMRLAYCRKGNGVDNSAVVKVKLDGQGKMPVVNQRGEVELYATIDRSKKANRRKSLKDEDQKTEQLDTATLNYENVEVIQQDRARAEAPAVTDGPPSCPNYANIHFAQSLEHYENSRDVLLKAGITPQEMRSIGQPAACTATKMCSKCGHCQGAGQPPAVEHNGASQSEAEPAAAPANTRLDDYMMMDPNRQPPAPAAPPDNPRPNNFPGYLPMSPITNGAATLPASNTKADLMKMALDRLNGAMTSEKSASIPSLAGPYVDRGKKRQDSEFVRIPGSAMLMANHSSATSSPYFRRMADCKEENKKFQLARRRSNSADSSRYLEDLESVSSSTGSRVSSVNSLLSQCELPAELPTELTGELPADQDDDEEAAHRCCAQDGDSEHGPGTASASGSSASIQTLVQEAVQDGGTSSSSSPSSAVHIRRSSSVPCKGNNRDSSSSNDSGVSIGSLRHRGSDFTEFELPLTTALSSNWRAQAQRLAGSQGPCMHASLQRRSKSSDPLKEISFQFHRMSAHPKSSSAEAEVPVCPAKKGN